MKPNIQKREMQKMSNTPKIIRTEKEYDKALSRIYDLMQVNLSAELQIRMLHEKMDHLMINQHRQFVEMPQIQMGLIQEIEEKIDKLN